jgi:hypothetical protein
LLGEVVNALTPIADKLGKLLRLLTSSHDGEVLGAARALVRTLNNAGLDIHVLAEGIGGTTANGKKFSEEEALEIYQRGVQDGRRAAEAQGPITFHDVGNNDPSWHAIATECATHGARLRSHEKEFVDDMVRWTVHGGKPTEKQAKWLRSIYVRIRH